MDFAKEARKLADELLPENTTVKVTLAFIERVALKLESAYAAGQRDGVKEGKTQEKERSNRRSAAHHRDGCYDEDCLGQCAVR